MKNSTNRSISRVTAACLAAAVVAGFASLPGFAAEPVHVKVSANAQVTYQHLQTGAALACGPVNRADLSRFTVWNKCYQATLQSAVDQVNEPTLVAIHQQHVARTTIGG
jgi:hypothetical protein